MIICCQCKVEMRCDKNSVGAAFGADGHVYAGDRFKCPICDRIILSTNAAPIYDPGYTTQQEYLKMIDNVKAQELIALKKDVAAAWAWYDREAHADGITEGMDRAHDSFKRLQVAYDAKKKELGL